MLVCYFETLCFRRYSFKRCSQKILDVIRAPIFFHLHAFQMPGSRVLRIFRNYQEEVNDKIYIRSRICFKSHDLAANFPAFCM